MSGSRTPSSEPVRALPWSVAALVLLAPPLLAQEPRVGDDAGPPSGAGLAERIETAESRERREALVARVGDLPPPEQDAFVDWAAERRQERGWRWLADALARLGTRAAAGELAEVARAESETSPRAVHALEAMDPDVALEELVGVLTVSSRRVRAASIGAIATRVAARPRASLRLLADGLRDLEFRASREEVTRAADGVEAVVKTAYDDTTEPEGFARFAEFSLKRAPLALGLARGVRERLSRMAREGVPAPGDALGDPMEAERRLGRRVLEALFDHEAPDVRVAVYEGLPAAADALERHWARPLFADLDHAERSLQDAAWRALRALTGEDLPQSRTAWERWWSEGIADERE